MVVEGDGMMGRTSLDGRAPAPPPEKGSAGEMRPTCVSPDLWDGGSTMTPRSMPGRPGFREEMAMQDFVGRHMTHMLQPVADHVRQLQGQVEHLETVLVATGARAAQTKDSCDAQNQDIRALQQQLVQLSSRCDQQQADLSSQANERLQLHSDHDRTKAQLRRMKGEMQASDETIKSALEKLQDLSGAVEELQDGSRKLQDTSREGDEFFRRLEDGQKALSYKLITLEEDITGVSKRAITNQKTLGDLAKRWEALHEEDLKATVVATERMNNFDLMLGDLHRNLTKLEDRIKSSESGIVTLQRHAQLEPHTPHHQQHSQADVQKLIAEATDNQAVQARFSRLDQVEADAATFRKNYSVEQKTTKDALEELGKRIAATLEAIRGVEESQQRHAGQLRRNDWSITAVQNDLKKLGEQCRNLELEVSEHLPAWQQEFEAKTNVQGQSLQQVTMDVQDARKDISHGGERSDEINKRLQTLAVDVEKLSKAHELCISTLAGFSKGFQDMSRSVSLGENGMLQPTRPSSALPRIRPQSAMASSRTP